MKQADSPRVVNSWLAVDAEIPVNFRLAPFVLVLEGGLNKYHLVKTGDWVLVINKANQIVRVAQVLRVRSDITYTTLYFDKVHLVNPELAVSATSFAIPEGSNIRQILWEDFEKGIAKDLQLTLANIPALTNQVYIRELLQLSVIDDLLGPAGGPNELIVDMSVRSRYLVGRLSPRESSKNNASVPIDASDSDLFAEDLIVKEVGDGVASSDTSRSGDDVDEEIEEPGNPSLIPSSMGLTFCINGDINQLHIDVLWGSYTRLDGQEHEKVKKNGQKAQVWQRIPYGGSLSLEIIEGASQPQFPDPNMPKVFIQGSIREKNSNGDRLITLFLINGQTEPESNGDSAWIFQPEIIVKAKEESKNKAIFSRRPIHDLDGGDPELQALEMVYRNRVEFAVGHGTSIHAEPSSDPNLAVEIRTAVIPQYEVQATETPGANSSDRPAMKAMLNSDLLNMKKLASLDVDSLISALNTLTKDYQEWINEQKDRIGLEVANYDDQANESITKTKNILGRLQDGINTLKSDQKALEAFRFTNEAMALQRIQSQYALEIRRGNAVTVDQFDLVENYTWRPFQLAFLLLSIPALANLAHVDRTDLQDAYADLLWFPTGGGKTEAYLGVAAFAMAIRRFQGNLGGYDGSRGLAVIMRYTLRLLTLQQFQRATSLICAMEVLRLKAVEGGNESLGKHPFSIGLWVGNKVTPGDTARSAAAIQALRNNSYSAGSASPLQLTNCPWCGSKINAGMNVVVSEKKNRTFIYCGDPVKKCIFSKGDGLPVLTVDEEIYHRPPTMMIATVDKFAMMAWNGQVRTLFGKAEKECSRHGLIWPDSDCVTGHRAGSGLAAASVNEIDPIRPPDLIIQDEFHLISGPLGTMVGLYESAVDELCTWRLGDKDIRPKIIASTATVRKAIPQVNNVFARKVSVFPPSGLDIEDNYFSIQRTLGDKYGRRYFGICSPGSSRPSVLIRVYTALLAASQELFNHFGRAADPYMTLVGYFNSLRELGGMKRLAEDDVKTRSFRIDMSMVDRPGLAQRSITDIRELTSRVSSQKIPEYLDQLEVKFKQDFDLNLQKYVSNWEKGETRAIDVVLATNMLSVGVDINRLGLMVVNGQPKGTAEYIQATSRVGRSFPGLVCTVLNWSRPRDLSHYETYEHYHATFYKHVEAQSVTPFSPRALDRGLTGTMLSILRLQNENLNSNQGAGKLKASNQKEMSTGIDVLSKRAWNVTQLKNRKNLIEQALKRRADEWSKKASVVGRVLVYKNTRSQSGIDKALIESPGLEAWDTWTVPMSMREVEPGVQLIMNKHIITEDPEWKPRPIKKVRQDKK